MDYTPNNNKKYPSPLEIIPTHTLHSLFMLLHKCNNVSITTVLNGTATAVGDQHFTMVHSLVHRLGYLATVRQSIATSLLPIQNRYISKQEPLLLLIFSFLMSNSTSSSAYNFISHTCVMI